MHSFLLSAGDGNKGRISCTNFLLFFKGREKRSVERKAIKWQAELKKFLKGFIP